MKIARYLTKTRFKLALECPTKLFYTGKPDQFIDNKKDDHFLRMLADGGFQVGELAKLMFFGGEEVSGLDHEDALARTAELLQKDEVVIFEAAIRYQDLFIRIDVLKKRGNHLELVEVKAKSFDPRDARFFRGANGQLNTKILPYLQDVAFQKFVLRAACPGYTISTFLMMADKSKQATIGSLNQHFRVCRDGNRCRVMVDDGIRLEDLGESVLAQVPADEYVDEILSSPLELTIGNMPFDEAVHWLASKYVRDNGIEPVLGSHCAMCEFRTPSPDPRSGFHTCWKKVQHWTDADFAGGTVLDLWNFRRKDELIRSGILKLSQVRKDSLDVKKGVSGLSRSERQWMQVSGEWPGGGAFYLDRKELAEQMRAWRYPLHFIDFETSRTALPFHQGLRPYEQVAFQFSHHVVHVDGRVEHAGEFLEARPGVFPNYQFVRELRHQLTQDEGSILCWASHENSVLRDIRRQLEEDALPPEDKEELQSFILEITEGRQHNHRGKRAMIDLCKLAERYYFHPQTRGSCSLKQVLPAVMSSSARLKNLYSKPVYGAAEGMPSHNFIDWTWWVADQQGVCDPYALLPPVFADLDSALLGGINPDEEDASLAQGGAALEAYGRLQFEDLSDAVRARIEAALLKYCELDTLAMVMICQAWMAEI